MAHIENVFRALVTLVTIEENWPQLLKLKDEIFLKIWIIILHSMRYVNANMWKH